MVPPRELVARLHGSRLPGLRTAKLTLAAVLSYLLAGVFDTSEDRVLAPLTALLVVQLTLYSTLERALGRVVSVLAGVVVAVAVSELLGVSWWSFGLLVLASLVIGRLLRLRESLLEVPISAMIVLALGGSTSSAAGRVVETLLGGAAGLLVNLVVAPPLHVRSAEDAVERLAGQLAAFLDELAEDLRGGWSRGAADGWLDRARQLARDVERASRDLDRAEESTRMHPRGGRARAAGPRLGAGLSGLEHCYVTLRNLCRALLDRAYFVPEDQQSQAYPEPVREALAAVLGSLAEATRGAGAFTSATRAPDVALGEVLAVLATARVQRDELARLLAVSPDDDQGAWQQHGALLSGVDRLRVELESAVRPGGSSWQPVPLGEGTRNAVRKAVSTSRRRRRAR